MSSDNAFAAQFWLWPDPAMKRDSQGRILFVNNAFLNLYGGTVEAWTGNVLQGWPAPQPPQQGGYPVPYRFETRMPAEDPNQGEQVYDWIEQTEANGAAFALARNVTAFVQAQTVAPMMAANAATPIQPDYQAEDQHHMVESSATPPAQPLPEAEPAENQVAEAHSAEIEYQAPFHEAPAQYGVTDQGVVEAESVPHNFEAEAPVPNTAALHEQIEQSGMTQNHQVAFQHETIDEDYQVQTPEMEPSAQVPDAAPAVSNEDNREERSFERRALPLESNSAVLGNNWRDAVIAKAVGQSDPEASEPKAEPTVQNVNSNSDESSGPNKRILLAEDNAINALLTRTLLEAEGHIVETVEDGALAVEAMKTQSFDLIFMDMRMPNMDGLESTRKIRQLPNVPKSLPIIALTANAFDDDRNACFDSGMNDFMTKPVSADELSDMVKNWTDKNKLDLAG